MIEESDHVADRVTHPVEIALIAEQIELDLGFAIGDGRPAAPYPREYDLLIQVRKPPIRQPTGCQAPRL